MPVQQLILMFRRNTIHNRVLRKEQLYCMSPLENNAVWVIQSSTIGFPIHASVKGVTTAEGWKAPRCRNFNPRSREGSDYQSVAYTAKSQELFQSPLP